MRNYAYSIPLDVITKQAAVSRVADWLLHDGQHYVITPNPEMAVMAIKLTGFRSVLDAASLSLVDGSGLYFAAKIAGVPLPEKIAGADFVESLLKELPSKTRFFFLGAEDGVGERAAQKARQEFGAQIVGTCEPPRNTYEVVDDRLTVRDTVAHTEVLQRIREAKPEILFVALGHGVQERWIAAFQRELPTVRVAMGVGGTLDYLAGAVARAPRFLRRLHLEWLWRLFQQPSRWRRILTAIGFFPLVAIAWTTKSAVRYRSNVVACILNADKDILIVSRVSDDNHWQLPQGGREPGETIEIAALREVKEEVGMVSLKVIGRTDENVYRYSWKRRYQANNQGINFSRRSAYKGQAQTIVYLQFTGLETEITLDTIEHNAWRWVSQKELVQLVHPVRRPIVMLALAHLPETLKQSYE